ncbi:hypothetical protein DUT91_00075 [Phyllobacterium salinisoli]|uniref:Flagellar biosynthesis protein FliO n=1 Tax=Phyllobacterium salinisoli TaxID=1899321 RepID=A0A368KA20_9HYPH|nr:flagellar biosynthetic protein FliO [Phyllobacterium salinisoli]RCS25262.1 hypothetical protein DUT91_00075 [Phyllobacterium salinisoli]
MNEWLTGIVGENAARVAGFILLFLLILLAIVVVFAIIRRLTGGTFVSGGRGRAPRLSVMDAAAVDSRRRLVLVRRDNVEHLILIGGPTDLVVEQNIVHTARAQSRPQASKAEPEPVASTTAPSPALSNLQAREQQVAEVPEPEPFVATEPAPPIAPPISSPNISSSNTRQPSAPAAFASDRTQEQPRPAAPPSRPATPQPVPAPAAPKPAPQFTQRERPAPSYPPQPRTVLPPQPPAQPITHPRHPAHPAYPLSQVAKGVISATSGAAGGAAAVSGAAASLDIAPSRDIPPAREAEKPAPTPSPSGRDMPDRSPNDFDESPAAPTPPPPAKEDISAKLDTFSLELHDAILDDFAIDDVDPAGKKDNYPAGGNIPDAELVSVFEDQSSSDLNISPTQDASDKAETSDLEDEMEKLLGELSKSNRN